MGSAAKGMDLVDLEKRYGNFLAPAFSIEVEGTDVRGAGAEIGGVTVDNVLDGADQFSFGVNNPYDPARSDFAWSSGGPFEVGRKVKIRMGYAGGMEALLEGLITSVKLTFPAGGSPQLEVSGYDFSHLMMKGKRSFAWNDRKDSDVVSQVAARHGFSGGTIEGTPVTHPQIRQDKESDYDFVKKLADRNGFEFFVFGTCLHFRKPARDRDALISLRWGRTLVSFAPEINIADQVTDVKVMGWDPASKKEIVGQASRGEEDKKGKGEKSGSEIMGGIVREKVVEEVRRPVDSKAHADALAKAILNRMSEGLVKGTGECIGLPLLRPGLNVALEGLGKKFSKTYYVEKTTHAIGSSGYRTTFGVKDNSI